MIHPAPPYISALIRAQILLRDVDQANQSCQG
jgi:hypothetical protein